MKKIISLLLCAILFVNCIPGHAVYSEDKETEYLVSYSELNDFNDDSVVIGEPVDEPVMASFSSKTETTDVTVSYSDLDISHDEIEIWGEPVDSPDKTDLLPDPGYIYEETHEITTFAVGSTPTVTGLRSTVTSTTVALNGRVTNTGGSSIIFCGFWIRKSTETAIKEYQAPLTPTSFNFLIPNLEPNTTYVARAIARNSGTTPDSGYSPAMTFTTPAATPSVPLNFRATSGNGQVTLVWSAPASNGGSAITRYQVSSNSGASWITAATTTGHTFTGLTNGVSYTFRVRAVNSVGNGSEATVSVTPVGTFPTVTGSRGTLISTSVVLNGIITNTGGTPIVARGFWIHKLGETTNKEVVVLTTTNSFSATITNLEPNTIYEARALARNSGTSSQGAGFSELIVFTTPAAVPSAPQSFRAAPGNGQVILNWSAPSSVGSGSILRYEVSKDSGSTWVTASSMTGHTFTGLTNGVTYVFRVRAVSSYGSGSQATVSVAPVGAVPIVTGTIGSVTSNSVALYGTVTNTGGSSIIASGFVIHKVGVTTSKEWSAPITSNSFSLTIYDLEPNTTYEARAYARNSSTSPSSGYSSLLTFTTPAATLTLSTSTWTPSATQRTTTINVTSNTKWNVSSNQSWLTITNIAPSTQTGNGSFRLDASASDGAQRVATVIVTGGGLTRSLTVTQKAGTFTVTPGPFSFGPDADGKNVTVSSNTTFSVTNSNSWLIITNTTTGFRINCTANTGAGRTGTITVTSGGQSQTITVTQSARLGLSRTSWEPESNADNISITVTTGTTWIATSSASWLTVSNVTLTGFRLNCAENAGNQRTATITVKTTCGTVSKTITVIQKAASNEPFPYISTQYSQELAVKSSKYAMLAYEECIVENGVIRSTKVPKETLPTALFDELEQDGFKADSMKWYNYGDDREHNVCFTLAQKQVSYYGSTRTLIVVVIRGTHYEEWLGNMDTTGDRFVSGMINHYSFYEAMQDVKTQLATYTTNISNPLVLITGHSRGAAVANLLAHNLNSDSNYGLSDVFAYAFATPNNTTQPSASDRNIFNFCFTDDFVPKLPLNNWGFYKHGATSLACAEDAYNSSSTWQFRQEMFQFTQRSANRNPYFNQNATDNVIEHFEKVWESTAQYYNKTTYDEIIGYLPAEDDQIPVTQQVERRTLYRYMRDTIAPAAMGGNVTLSGDVISQTFFPITSYFVMGQVFRTNLFDTHGPFTYYAAMLHGVFPHPNMRTFSMETPRYAPTGIHNPANANQGELMQLRAFAQQEDNLERLGWNLNDISTWHGIYWTEGAENRIQSIDLSYLFVFGQLDLSGFSALTYLDISGNLIYELDLAGCDSLKYFNCFNNALQHLAIPSAEIVECGFNKLLSLNVSGAVNLERLYCNANQLDALNLSRNTVLTELDCAENNLWSLDLSANMELSILRCERNYLDTQEGSDLWTQIQLLESSPTSLVYYTPQKLAEDIRFNATDLAALTQFFNQDDNGSKLGWNISKPETWTGVQWIFANGEYHVLDIMMDNLALTGTLNFSGMEQLTRVSCSNNSLTAINLVGCERLTALFARNAGLHSLSIANTPSLRRLDCEVNYLNIQEIMEEIDRIQNRNDSWVFYGNQKLLCQMTIATPNLTYHATSSMLIFDMVTVTVEGTSPSSVFIEISIVDASQHKTSISSDTIPLNASGMGTYHLGAPPVAIAVVGQSAEIAVYTDSSRSQLITALIVKPLAI
jgi:Fibronectin type III domain./Lipase (class 3).